MLSHWDWIISVLQIMDYPEGEFELDTDAYVKRVLELQEEYKDRIRICLGVELGMQEHLKERQQAYIEKYPFDFVIGSMHLIHGEDPYFGKIYEEMGDEEAYREYFRATLDERFSQEIDAILQYLISHQIALEVNTAGLRMLGFTNPHPDVIRRYREMGGELITVGSDGHVPEYLGYGFVRLPELLSDCGFDSYTVFRQGKPEFRKVLVKI